MRFTMMLASSLMATEAPLLAASITLSSFLEYNDVNTAHHYVSDVI